MDIKLLKSFVAVASTKNFSAAARDLNTVQPAISRHISDLEEELGVSLFWRNTREVKITAAGRSLFRDAQEILFRELKAKERARWAARGEIGHLRIGYLGAACFSFIPGLVRAYSDRYPNVHVSLSEMTAYRQVEAFSADRIDVGFSRPLPETASKDFSAEEIYVDTLIAVTPETHPLANRKNLRLRELQADPFILFNRGEAASLFDQIISACQKEKFAPLIASQPVNYQTVLTEVAAGLGVSVVPGCVRRLHTEGCAFIPIHKQKPSIPTVLHYRSDPLLPTVEAFVEETLKFKTNIQKLVSVLDD